MKLNDLLFTKANYNFDTLITKVLLWTRKNRWKLFLLILFSSAFVIVMVSNVRSINKQLSKVRKLEHKYEALNNNNKILQKEISDLQSPERIIKIAKDKLHMKTNDHIPYKLKQANDE